MMRKFLTGFFILFFVFLYAPHAFADDLALTGSNSFSGSVSVAMPITDLQITGTTPGITPVKLRVTSGTLSMSTTTGLTFTGGSTGSTLYFSGTLANINAALATLTYTRGSTGSDTLEVSLVNSGEVFFPDNGHLYKFISGSIDWTNARTGASGQTAYNSNGYLATITSSSENDFVAGRLVGDGWFGASDSGSEGTWKWVTGPETNTTFWSGASGGSTVGGNYANWAGGEPNDSSSNEDCAQFYISTGKWNDLPCSGSNLAGYVVEFGATGNMPVVIAKNISITTTNAPTVSSVSPADNATNISPSANLVLNFSANVTSDTGSIVIKKTSDDTTFETIPVGSGLVTGGGTSTITINPAGTFLESTGYYVLIDSTAFKNISNAYYAGISSKTVWNFTTGDFTAPTILSVSSSKSDGAYKAGETITATVTFSESITSTGNVTLTFETGTTDQTCTFTVSSDTTGSCTYTVQAGDTSSDLDVIGISGVIRDASSNTLTNFIPASTLAATKAIVIDTTAPVLTQVTPIPSSIYIDISPVYYFSASEEGSYTIGNCGTGNYNVVVDGNAGTVRFNDLSLGYTYRCDLQLLDRAGNVSNVITVGPFTISTRKTSHYTPAKSKPPVVSIVNTPTMQPISQTPIVSLNTVPFPTVRDLTVGMKGEDVRMLQTLLISENTGPKARALKKVTATGYFSSYTRNALAEYQAKHSIIPAIGYFGIITRTEMKGRNLERLWW